MRIACGKVEGVAGASLGDGGGEWECRVAAEQRRGDTVLIMTWKKFGEYAVRVPLGGFAPFGKRGGEIIADGVVFEADKCVVAEALDPAVGTGRDAVCGGSRSGEYGELRGFQPDDG